IGGKSVAFGFNNRSMKKESSAFGIYNKADGEESAAFGNGNEINAWGSSAFGIYNKADGEESAAFGISNETNSWGNSAFGIHNIVVGEASSAFGFHNRVNGHESSAFGRKNTVDSENSTAVGSSLFVSGENSGSFGNGIMKEPELIPTSLARSISYNIYLYKNEGKNSYTIGNYNTIARETENNFILGNDNIIGYVENNSTLRSGSSIKGKANNNFIIGNKVKIQEGISNSVVLGNESAVRQATTETKGTVGSIEFGGFAGQGKPENGVVSVGAKDKERQIINVAAGKVSKDSTDAINGSQLFSAVQELAKGTNHYYSVNSKEMGEGSNYKNDGATAEGAVAAGVKAKAVGKQSTSVGYANNANGDFSTAIGAENIANGERSIALGYQNEIKSDSFPHKGRGVAIGNSNIVKNSFTGITVGDNNKLLRGEYAAAFGTNNTASAKNTTVIGRSNEVSSEDSTALGKGNKVEGQSAIAAGNGNKIKSKNSTAVGNSLFVSGENSGSFGNGFQFSDSSNPYNYKYKNEGKNSYTIGNFNSIADGTENNFILGNEVNIQKGINNVIVFGKGSKVEESNVVSIGAKGMERKIVHVKAGEADTDAVNVSQLKETNSNLTIKGIDFAGNDENKVHRNLGETLALKGEGVTKEQSEKFEGASGNINVKKNNDGSLEVQLAKDLQNITSISNGNNKIVLNTDKVVLNQTLHMGDANKQNQIKFVADGTQETDAVNFRQLEKAKTRYYSVKSSVTGEGSNYNNDGATGKDAMAAGVKAKAAGMQSTSVGYANIVEKNANYSSAVGHKNQIKGSHSSAFGDGNLIVNGLYSSVIGAENKVYQGKTTAVGYKNEIKALDSSVLGLKNTIEEGAHISVFGEENRVKGSHISAFGEGNKVTGNNSLAIGEKNEVEGRYDFVLGTENKVKGDHNTVLGEKNEIAKNSEYNFILGSNVKVKENVKNSVVLGKDSTVEESDVVSIGTKGKERKIVHVKAGVNDTDAVNVSQLKKYSSDLEKKGLNFAGNDEKSVHRDLGATLALKGEGVDKAASENFRGASGNINVKNSKEGELLLQLAEELKNIKSIANGDNKIILEGDKVIFNQTLHMGNTDKQHQIKYVADGTELTDAVNLKQLKEYNAELEKKGLNFAGNDGKVIHKNLGEQLDIVGSLGDGEDASSQNLRTRKTDDGKLELLLAQNLNLNSVTTGNTIINNFGVTIQNGDKKVTLSENGLDNGGNKIINVAEGTEKTDAVNKGQLDKAVASATTEVTAGKNIDVAVTTGSNGQKIYQIGLKDKITLGEGEKAVEIDGEQGTLKVGNKITMDGTTGNAAFGKVAINGEQGTVNGLTNITWDPNNYTSGQAATEDQLKVVDKKVEDLGTTIGKGYTFAGDSGSVNKKLGDTVKITGDGKNITTSVTKDGELKVELNKKIEVEQITSEKMILKNSDGSTTDVGETLKEHSEKIEENAQSIKKGLNFAGNHGTTNKQLGDTMSIKGKEGLSLEEIKKNYDVENVVTEIDEKGNLVIKFAKKPKFESVEAGEGDTKVTIGNDGVKIGDKTYITKDGLNANNQKIVNVADGTIAKDSKDAVNGGQIHNIVQDINNSINQTNQRVDKLDDRMHRGLANSAAMATLEFLEIGINQATVGAAVGTYRGNQAVAVGVQAAPTENTRVHAKVSVAPSRNNTETMAGVGASWRFNWK
ncbi:MAG: YadA-like family protein, partial [Fusobacterium necrophorum]|nr:YadA-like family protein [Fusobacterium necrophorum]